MQTHIKIKLSAIISIFIILIINFNSTAQEIWGMTKYGGEYNKGVIFKLDQDATNHEVVFSFEKMGLPEGKMTEYTDGVFYGMTTSGWGPSFGIIYRFESATGGFTKVIEFDGVNTGKDGAGSLILASNGLFYGMTASGGAYDKGVLFEFNPETETFTKKVDFNGFERGSEPLGSLIESSDGRLYGMTSMGGKFDAGILFSYDLESGSFTKLIQFDGGEYGSNPMGSLCEAADGFLYGMTRWGGVYNHGVIFQYDRLNRKIEIKFDFNGPETGRNPHGSLTEAANGKLYGITPFGGPFEQGVIFEFDPSSTAYLINHNFLVDQSYGSLLEAPDKKLYGVFNNSLDTAALIFDFDPETKIFNELGRFPNDMRYYYGSMESLMLTSSGKLFFWGRDNFYIDEELFLFEFDYELSEVTNYYTNGSISTGSYPLGQLVQTSNDSLFGLAGRGGKFDHGLIYMFNPVTNTFKKLIDFDGTDKGATPTGSLILAENSKLYGMTSRGGEADKGVLFEFDPATGGYKKMFDFDGLNTGGNPNGNLVKAANGKLYGMTISGGNNDNGSLFEFDPASGAYKNLMDFEQAETGTLPRRSLTQANDRTLYGVTKFGGAYNAGMLFLYNIETGMFKKIADCNHRPVAIMQASSNKLYVSGYRTVYEYNPDNGVYSQLESLFTAGLVGELYEVSKDVLWGMDFGEIAYQSGTEDRGMIFEINLNTNEFSVKNAFTGPNGKHPEHSGLIKLQLDAEPVASCKDTILYLDETGQAILFPDDVNNASSGNEIKLSIDKSIFTCEDTGEKNVVLTATDLNGNSATCNAVVSIKDTLPPETVCRNFDLFLDESGNAVIEVADVDNGSGDACGIESMVLDITSFSCENTGENTVQLSVSDNNGNSSVCYATINVIDSIAPDISYVSVASRFLEPYKEIFTAEKDSELNAEATDNCGIQSLTCTIQGGEEDYTGSSLNEYGMRAGTYTIEWKAADESNNISSSISAITIEKRPVTLLALEKETDYEKEEVQLKAVLMDDLLTQGIVGKTLVFAVDELSREAVTDENGVATVSVPLEKLPAGTYDVVVSFGEDDTYASVYLESEIITGTNFRKTADVRVYPNPFSEKLFIEFVARETATARIDLFDSSGRLVETIFDKPVEAGMLYKAEFKPLGNPASLYIYRMRNGNNFNNGKVVFRE